TGSGLLASSVGMEKVFAKQVFLAHGIPTPAYRSFDGLDAALAGRDALPFPFPVVVKPSREGSSVGVHICRSAEDYAAAVEDASRLAGPVLGEPVVPGREAQGAVRDAGAPGALEG